MLPALNVLENDGLQVKSYAYPYGAGNDKIDSILISKGLTVRYAGWNASHQV